MTAQEQLEQWIDMCGTDESAIQSTVKLWVRVQYDKRGWSIPSAVFDEYVQRCPDEVLEGMVERIINAEVCPVCSNGAESFINKEGLCNFCGADTVQRIKERERRELCRSFCPHS